MYNLKKTLLLLLLLLLICYFIILSFYLLQLSLSYLLNLYFLLFTGASQ